jgi:NADPH:quinone reductase-like Zn-dependent oxidoreductase
MQALVHTAYGSPEEVLAVRELEQPTPATGEVLVRVRAAGVARGAWLITKGLPYIARPAYGLRAPRHPIAGLEFAGTVATLGPDVSGFAPGEAVFGHHLGALAEYVAVPAEALARKPERITFPQAAVVPISGTAALQAVRDAGRVAAGQRVLVIGASGSVGTFAVQLAKAQGATVVGVASRRNLDRVRALGADDTIDYTREGIAARGDGYDVILDLAGNRPVARLRRLLRRDGTLVIVGGSGGRWTMGFQRTVGGMLLSPFVPQRIVGLISTPNGADLRLLASWIAEGRLTPLAQEPLPFRRAAEAVALAGAGHGVGAIAVAL